MSVNQKSVVSPPTSSSSSDSPDNILPISFKLKPIGSGGTKNTLVENDSLSSYSWPEETPRRQNGTRRFSGENPTSGENTNKELEAEETKSVRRKYQGRKCQVAIEMIGDVKSREPTQDSSYVEAYMKLMYWTCVSPFNPAKKLDGGGSKSWCDLMLSVVQKIFVVVITILSMIQSVFEIKQNLLDNLSYPDLETFTDLCFFIMNGATKVYFVYLFLRQQVCLMKMLSSIETLRAAKLQTTDTTKKRNSSVKYAFMLVISSYIVTIIQIICGHGIIGWTAKKAILHHSKSLGKSLNIWKEVDHINETLRHELDEKYGNKITETNLCLGIFRSLIIFSSNIQMDAVTNVMLTNAETINEEMKGFERLIKDKKKDVENINLEEFLDDAGYWAHYNHLKLTVKDNNDAMDVLMRYKHINNVMLFVYFAMNAFDGQYSLIHFFRFLYNMVLTSYTYRIASQASSLNDELKNWVLRLAWKSTNKSFQEKVPLILYELEKEPIGLGKGQFMINESFIFRFLGSVGSVFVLQAQARGETVDCGRV